MTVTLRAGEATLADWRDDLARRRASRSIPPIAPAVVGERRGGRAHPRRGEPVYGINTGFGKLASVRIGPGDLATLQRNIVLSHAAGVGEPMSTATTRLMMALKLGEPRPGRLGRAARRRSLSLRRCSSAA